MIEEKLDRLATAIEALVITLADNQLKAEAAKRASEPVKTPTPKPEANPEPETEKPATTETITIADLTELCLAKVRENRDNKDKIKAIIKSHGGELIKDVDEAQYPALKAKLEAL